MKETYQTAINQVLKSEGGYTNDPHDPGGPTNWGITIADARHYWKADATAEDVQAMPKSVAEEIYQQHYARPVEYNSLPAGVDFSVLDYAVNSGVSRSVKTLQALVGVEEDGQIGPLTLQAVGNAHPDTLIDKIWDQRLAFDQSLSTWSTFGHGWQARINAGRELAHSLSKTQANPNPGIDPTNAALSGSSILSNLSSFLINLFKKGK